MDIINSRKEISDMNEAPTLESNKIYYNCSECSSTIEIVSINKNNIEFKCNNKHYKKINIKEYLEKMKNYNNIEINSGECKIHKEDYLVYCFECNEHLCKECLKLGEHSYHYKINIIEILPKSESLTKINDIINSNKVKIKNLNITKTKTENQLNDILRENINKITEKEINKKEIYDKKEKKELSLTSYYFHSEIKKLKDEYEEKIKNVKLLYNKNINTTKN